MRDRDGMERERVRVREGERVEGARVWQPGEERKV